MSLKKQKTVTVKLGPKSSYKMYKTMGDHHNMIIINHFMQKPNTISTLDHTMTLTQSTLYRKFNRLKNAGILIHLEKGEESGYHNNMYQSLFDGASISISKDVIAVTLRIKQKMYEKSSIIKSFSK